jgi:hypothetical protein
LPGIQRNPLAICGISATDNPPHPGQDDARRSRIRELQVRSFD